MTDDPRFRRLFRAMMNDPSGFIMGDPTCCRLFRQMVGDPTSPDIGDIRVPPSIERVPDRWFVYAGVQLWSALVRMLWCLLQTWSLKSRLNPRVGDNRWLWVPMDRQELDERCAMIRQMQDRAEAILKEIGADYVQQETACWFADPRSEVTVQYAILQANLINLINYFCRSLDELETAPLTVLKSRPLTVNGHRLTLQPVTVATTNAADGVAVEKTSSHRPAKPTAQPGSARDDLTVARHSEDFRSVFWYGTKYFFTDQQALCVAFLWQAWENKTPEVGGRNILEEVKNARNNQRFDMVFRKHPAWGRMIVRGATKGSYRLADPSYQPPRNETVHKKPVSKKFAKNTKRHN